MTAVTSPHQIKLDLYERMLMIRRFEEAAYRAYEQGDISGTIHVSIGQEAVAVGVISALDRSDGVFTHHRGHGHALAKGVDPARLMAELFARRDGVSGGKGGSMHATDLSCGFLGSLAVVGGSVPLAVGVALAHRVLRRSAICTVFFGDGAVNQGVVYESFNLAAIWNLPVLFVCENNGFAISVRTEHATGGTGITERAAAFGLAARSVDGQDVNAVQSAALELVAHCRSTGPVLLECRTYRFMGHSRGDPPHGLYRSQDEVAGWRERDPLTIASEQLDGDDVDAAGRRVDEAVERALDFARASPAPDPGDVAKDVWG
jgi:acetoin:2,6-dichlorophenolindophenol oxidoreductase subunit alpha